VLDLLAAAGEYYSAVTVAERWATSADLDAALGCDDYLIMGDGVTAGSDGPLRGRGFSLSDWGYAPATLATYVRDRAVTGLEQAVHRMTMAPARQAGVFDRGVIAPGYAADIVAFDLASLAAGADPARLREPPGGVRDVLVNGCLAVRSGQLTGALAGRVGVPR
jgi:N-acyl-D-amino-acid deacylase